MTLLAILYLIDNPKINFTNYQPPPALSRSNQDPQLLKAIQLFQIPDNRHRKHFILSPDAEDSGMLGCMRSLVTSRLNTLDSSSKIVLILGFLTELM